jgi:hypothetical protein
MGVPVYCARHATTDSAVDCTTSKHLPRQTDHDIDTQHHTQHPDHISRSLTITTCFCIALDQGEYTDCQATAH